MSMPESYLEYPRRRRGNDHDWFGYVPTPAQPKVSWAGDAPVALSVTVLLQHFPLQLPPGPVQVPGVFYLPGPAFMPYTLGDYGNRVGAYRLFRLLDAYGIKATVAFNSDVARRYPRLVEEVVSRGWEVAAAGVNMGMLIHGHMPPEEERAIIAESLATLREISGQRVRGWHSPARSQSDNTFALLAEHGVEYAMDWANDDMPFRVNTASGMLHNMPLADQWSDETIIVARHQPVDEFEKQNLAAYRVLKDEAARRGGRVFSIALHGRVGGQPYMAAGIDQLLSAIAADGGAWNATAGEILVSYRAQSDV